MDSGLALRCMRWWNPSSRHCSAQETRGRSRGNVYRSGDSYRCERKRGKQSLGLQPYLWPGGNWESQNSVDYTSKKSRSERKWAGNAKHPCVRSIPVWDPSPCEAHPCVRSIPLWGSSLCEVHPYIKYIAMWGPSLCEAHPCVRSIPIKDTSLCGVHPYVIMSIPVWGPSLYKIHLCVRSIHI